MTIYIINRVFCICQGIFWKKMGIIADFVFRNSRFMPEVVKQAFLNILMKEGNFTFEQSKACLLAMEKGGRYMQETWS